MLTLNLTLPQILLLITGVTLYRELLKFGFKKALQLIILRTRRVDTTDQPVV
jgi:hypothetical protein